jgi:hypothetical protein
MFTLGSVDLTEVFDFDSIHVKVFCCSLLSWNAISQSAGIRQYCILSAAQPFERNASGIYQRSLNPR